MTRRKILIGASVGAVALGVAGLVGLADHFGVLGADEDDDDEDGGSAAVARGLRFAKVSLQQGLAASEREGQAISAKFEVDRGNNFQLSVYTSKDGGFSEVLVDYSTGEIKNVSKITAGDDLAAAQAQSSAMAKAKTSLRDVVEKTLAGSAGFRAVGVVPNLKDGRAVASVLIIKGEDFQIVNQPLD